METKIQQRRKRVNTIFIGQQEVMELQGRGVKEQLNSAREPESKVQPVQLRSNQVLRKKRRVSSLDPDLMLQQQLSAREVEERKSKSKKRVQFIIEETMENESQTATVMSEM